MLLAQPGGGDSSSLSLPLELSLACKLYRVIRSGGRDFSIAAEDDVATLAGGFVNDICGWKDGGACCSKVNILPQQICDCLVTYRIQPLPRQDSFRRSLHAPSIPMQVPHNVSAIQLRKHLGYLVDLRRSKPEAVVSG